MVKQYFKNSIKKVTLALALAVGFTSITLPASQASAATIGIENISSVTNNQEFDLKLNAISKALVFENGKYKIDRNAVENGVLTAYEMNQIDLYFANVDLSVIDKIQEDVSSTFLQGYEIDTPDGVAYLPPLIPIAVVAFLGTLAAKIGWDLASKITADFYKWGVTSGCNKWKGNSTVKSFCKANGYLK